MRSWIIPAIVAASLGAACQSAESAPGSRVPSALVLAPGARDKQLENRLDGSIAVSYWMREEYPAEPFLTSMRMALPTSEWRPLPTDWLNPAVRSSHDSGWTQFTDASGSPPNEVHAWTAQWMDAAGNVVTYSLRYETRLPSEPAFVARPGNSKLHVMAVWVPSKVAEQMMATRGR